MEADCVLVLALVSLLVHAGADGDCPASAALDRRRSTECRWRRYGVADVVACLDDAAADLSRSKPLRVVFAGDSRMRQLFFSFLRVKNELLLCLIQSVVGLLRSERLWK